jgi:uncharacterized protein YeaO (DUF488 family)
LIRIKRTYDPPARGDGRRILVERLWPRGLKKEALAAAWVKEVAPSTKLRQWFDHRVERWEEFQRKYRNELDTNGAAWEPILEASKRGPVTLLYSAHDTLHNGALVLRDYLLERGAKLSPTPRVRPLERGAKLSPTPRVKRPGRQVRATHKGPSTKLQ